jgi:hypothetical protein
MHGACTHALPQVPAAGRGAVVGRAAPDGHRQAGQEEHPRETAGGGLRASGSAAARAPRAPRGGKTGAATQPLVNPPPHTRTLTNVRANKRQTKQHKLCTTAPLI